MRRVVVLGRGAAGKSTFAAELGRRTGIPVVELDRVFWQPGLVPLAPAGWVAAQRGLIAAEAWILDGDLGPADVLAPRLSAADTVVVFDFPLWRCAWRAVRRSRERIDFWLWVLRWRLRSRPALMAAIRANADAACVRVVRNRRDVERLFTSIAD
jgi:adenylate kinase family enzyme